jgi:hypothetical protein
MTITFESDKDIIVYALEKIISYTRNNQYIFLVQCIWWISSTIGLQEALVIYIDNLNVQETIGKPELGTESAPPGVHPDRVVNLQASEDSYNISEGDSVSTTETDMHNKVIDNCELFLEQSKQERRAIGCRARQASQVANRKANKKAKRKLKTFGTQTEGIDGSELQRRKAAGECQRCAWPRDQKGSHKTLDCFRRARLEKGTAQFPQKKTYNKD